MEEDFNKLKKDFEELSIKVNTLEQKLMNSTNLQDDFGGKQVIRRKVQFMAEVVDKDGNTQIN